MSRDAEATPTGVDPGAPARLWRQGSERLVRTITESFLTRTPERLDRARTALTRHDAETLARIAHDLRSSCDLVGAVSMALLCRRMEEGAGCDDPSSLEDALDELEAEFERVHGWVSRHPEGARK
jgi:HPt (histidine-containing phosphotransfer) domain-containing protein